MVEADPRQEDVRNRVCEAVAGCRRINELQTQARAGSNQRPLWQDNNLHNTTVIQRNFPTPLALLSMALPIISYSGSSV